MSLQVQVKYNDILLKAECCLRSTYIIISSQWQQQIWQRVKTSYDEEENAKSKM